MKYKKLCLTKYIVFHFNIILEHNGMSSTKKYLRQQLAAQQPISISDFPRSHPRLSAVQEGKINA
jgi:hypothetical protein